MTTKKLVWRLKEQPTTEALRELVKDGVLSKEEAREILFSSETEEDRDKKSLESEIKFLRELVEKLSNRTQIVETIKEVYKPYWRYEWYKPYYVWCESTPLIGNGTITCSTDNTLSGENTVNCFNSSFKDIKTF